MNARGRINSLIIHSITKTSVKGKHSVPTVTLNEFICKPAFKNAVGFERTMFAPLSRETPQENELFLRRINASPPAERSGADRPGVSNANALRYYSNIYNAQENSHSRHFSFLFYNNYYSTV